MSAVAPFTIGTSSNVTFSSGIESSGVDMSLDDMIAARRKEAQAQQKQRPKSKDEGNKKGNARGGIKKTQRDAAKSKKPTNVQKAVGGGKAKRNAKLANKRGISNDAKATPMQVEREVYRQQRTGGGRGGGNGRTRSETEPRRSERNRNNRSVADRNVKAKNKKQKQQQQKQKQQNVTPAPPTKRAMKAAMNALKDTGYVAPKGMKMVVSFVDSNAAKNANVKSQGNKNQKKKQSNSNSNSGNGNRNNNNNNNARNQNGNRRGGGRR